MARIKSESFEIFESTMARLGNTVVLDDESSVDCMGMLLQVIRDMGLNPMKTEDLTCGLMDLFNVEVINMPDMDANRFILAPNHVSEFDALSLGLLHPRIRIVSKRAWTDNTRLRQYLERHYDLCGLNRASMASLRHVMRESIRYFLEDDACKHYLVFSQGTISDFNHNSPERVSSIAQQVASKTAVPIVVVFVEQVSIDHPTRIVFDAPRVITQSDDFRRIWLEREAALQA